MSRTCYSGFYSTSFPGSHLPGKMRDPGDEVGFYCSWSRVVHVILTNPQTFGFEFHFRYLVDNWPSSWLLYFLLLHRANEAQPGRNSFPRLQFLAFSLDCVVHVVVVKLSTE